MPQENWISYQNNKPGSACSHKNVVFVPHARNAIGSREQEYMSQVNNKKNSKITRKKKGEKNIQPGR